MTRYQLAKLVEWAGKLESRKRIQKVVYLLQSAGCPIDADFVLHLYGPYTHDVANLSEEMVWADLLKETPEQFPSVTRFSYRLTDRAKELIKKYEAEEKRAEAVARLAAHEALAKELLAADLKELEIASTIAYFHDRGDNWMEAVAKACKFKAIDRESDLVRRALQLARRAAGSSAD